MKRREEKRREEKRREEKRREASCILARGAETPAPR
jgi:hypothetical protein